MSDDLGRGQVGWTADRWTALDAIAAEATDASVVMRNLVEERDEPNARTIRIAGADIPVVPLQVDFVYDMQNEVDGDLDRRVRVEAQNLAAQEDQAVIAAMNLAPTNVANLQSGVFINAKNQLRGQGVQQGVAIVVGSRALTDLESEIAGVRSGLELVERVAGTTIVQSNALAQDGAGNLHAVLLQASPAAFVMGRAYGPRLRVTGNNGTVVNLRIEEGIAVGPVMGNRAIGLRLRAGGGQQQQAPAPRA